MNAKVHADPSASLPQDVLTILESVIEERDRAMAKFGVQSHPDGTGGGAAEILRDQQRELVDEQARKGKSTWRDILMEEVREAFAETDLVLLDKELMQVQQVCLVWREHIARRLASQVLTHAVTVSARSLAREVEERKNDEQRVEAQMRATARGYDGLPALRSLANGGRPGRRWMLDNLRQADLRAKGNDSDVKQLTDWVQSLPDSWWDPNVMTSGEKEVHDVRVSEALQAQKEGRELVGRYDQPF